MGYIAFSNILIFVNHRFPTYGTQTMDPEQIKTNVQSVRGTFKRRLKTDVATDDAFQLIPLKGIRLMDSKIINERMTKIMVPVTYGYDGNMKTLKQSKLGKRRLSRWTEQNILETDEESQSNVENEAHGSAIAESATSVNNIHHNTVHEIDLTLSSNDGDKRNNNITNQTNGDAITESAEILITENEITSESVDKIDLTPGLSSVGAEVDGITNQSQSKPKKVMFRRRSARLSQSSDNYGSIFSEVVPDRSVNSPDSSKVQSMNNRNHSGIRAQGERIIEITPQQNNGKQPTPRAQAGTNESRLVEVLPQSNEWQVISRDQIEADESGAQIRTLEHEHGQDDCVGRGRKLWQTRTNSISDPLFRCFNIVGHQGRDTIKVACIFCDRMKSPLTCKRGNNSNLKAHLTRVSLNSK